MKQPDTSIYRKEKKYGQLISRDLAIVQSFFQSLPIFCGKCQDFRYFIVQSFNLAEFVSLTHIAEIKCRACGHLQQHLFAESELE